jgi:hypothetical protein
VFGATIDTLTLIKEEPENYIGMFYNEMDQDEVRMERVAIAQEENNRIMREDIQLIRDCDLDEMEIEGMPN